MAGEKQHSFKAEIKQVLQILIHSLYQDREIFLRELISNGSDAMTRLQFEQLTNTDIFDAEAEYAIHIETDEENKKMIIKDAGIGMTKDELAQNLGTIAQSGAREFLTQLEEGKPPTDIIGQFGVGFYSVFMVADEVEVISRSYKPRAKAAKWVSDGGDSYRVDSAEKLTRGTEMHISLKEDAGEFASPHRLREVIKKHSDFIAFPIYINGDQANATESLWRKAAKDIEEEEYQRFYSQMTFDFEPPLSTIHFATDMPISVRTLLFLPTKREPSPMALRRDPGVKLYSNNVLIQEYCTDLLPEWLNFVDGVVDSEDLPLNVSRETVQNNHMMRQLSAIIEKRVLRTIRQMGEKEPEKFEKFWTQFGPTLKQGMAVDPTSKEKITPLLHYTTSKSDGQLVSLKTIKERMADGQEAMYYVLADGLASAQNSPHLDPFKAKEWEVMYFTSPIDAFLVSSFTEFDETPLTNVDDADIQLDEPETDGEEADDKATNLFVGRVVSTLGERVTEVRVSKVLVDSPVRLVAPEGAPNMSGMDRIQRMVNEDYEVPARVMEVNKNHAIIQNLANRLETDGSYDLVDLMIEQLYESALVQEGLHPNPSTMLPRIQKLMEIASK